ncbi:MAG TPA: DUF2231 domain-containing protein [Pyrinomonadaceae bacterium]
MSSPASIGGHPIHPMLIPFPLALWFFSLIADLIYLWRGNPVWKNWIAFYALLAGIIGAVVAAIFGVIDWLAIKDREVKRTANWHARLNVIALLIFAASFYLRTRSGSEMVGGSYTVPLVLSVIGVILITISGYLGGELVFKHGVAVNPQFNTAQEER